MNKKIQAVILIFVSVLLFTFANQKANATTHTITVNSNFFNPAALNVLVGDTVHFQWVGGNHTTTCDDVILPGTSRPFGADAWDSPMNSGTTDFYYVVNVAGIYVYGCQPHWPGMQGTITAGYGYKIWAGILGGGDGSSWNDPLNWIDGVAPVSTDSVKLDNSQVSSTYVVFLPTGATNVTVKKLIIEPTAPNYIYLFLPSGNTNNPGLTVGDGVSGTYDFILYKNSIFTNSSGAASGTGFAFSVASDSIQLQDSALWIHNCTRGTSGITSRLSQASNCNKGIWRYDVPTTSTFSITASGVSYGSLQLYGLAGGGGLQSKKYIRTGTSAITVRGNYYIEEHAYDSTAMTNNFNIWGDYTNYGRTAYALSSTQTINFNGAVNQTIGGGDITGGVLISRAVNINNPAGVTINTKFYTDTLIMTQGNINTAGGQWIGVGYDATNTGYLQRTSGIVTGQLERWYLAGVVSDSLSYPVGTSSVLKEAKVRFSTAPTTQGRIGIKFVDNGTDGSDLPSTLNDGGFSLTRRSNSYWTMTGTFLTGGGIDVAFDGNGQEGITDASNMRVIWSNNSGLSFSLLGNHKNGNASIGRRTDIGLYFSDFYLAGDITNNPLPVELDNFIATTIKNEVILDWATGHELNNTGFEIQRAALNSSQSIHDNPVTAAYETIGFVTSKGNSNAGQSYKFNDKNLQAGRYAYRLKQIDVNGNHTFFLLNNEVSINLPGKFVISQNYPNPFNPVTNINYEMPFDGSLKIVVFDNLGREVQTLVNGNVSAGYYKAQFNGAGLPSGIYFYKVNASTGNQNIEKVFKMMLVK